MALSVLINSYLKFYKLRLYSIYYETSILDYVYNLKDIPKNYKNLKISEDVREEYNLSRKNRKWMNDKEQTVENYNSVNIKKYFNESSPSYVIEEEFLTAEYYNNSIGRVIINNCTYLFNENEKSAIANDFEKLKEKNFELLLDCFTDEYLNQLF